MKFYSQKLSTGQMQASERVGVHTSCTNGGSTDERGQWLPQTNEAGVGVGESRRVQMSANEDMYTNTNADKRVQTQVWTVWMSKGEGRHK